MTHTPTPWMVDAYGQIQTDPKTGCYETIATTPKAWIDNKLFNHDHADSATDMLQKWSERAQYNAEYIVRCVNSHDALVEALRYVRQFYQDNFNIMPVAFQTVDSEIEKALTLIEKGA